MVGTWKFTMQLAGKLASVFAQSCIFEALYRYIWKMWQQADGIYCQCTLLVYYQPP